MIYTTSVTSTNGVTISKNDDGTFTLNGTVTGSNAGIYFFGKYDQPKQLLPNGSYKYKVDGLFDNDAYAIRSIDNGNQAQVINGDVLTYSYPIYQVLVVLRLGNTYDNVIIKPMLVYGDDMPDEFVPGIEPQILTYPTPNGLPGIPVDSGGNYTDENGQQWYCDIVDFAAGTYTKNVDYVDLKNYGFTLNATWTNKNDTLAFAYARVKLNKKIVGTLSNKLVYAKWNTLPNSFSEYQISVENIIQNETIVYVILPKTEFPGEIDSSAVNNYLSTAGIYALVPLETPTETDLTPEQITAYAALTTYKPNTTVTTDSSPAAGVSVDYVADPKAYIDNKFSALEALQAQVDALIGADSGT